MNDESIQKSLQAIAQHHIPENTNLWPRLSARLEHKETLPMHLKWKLVWTILLVLLGLSALTGVAYAFYHYFNDAGLDSVSKAGLISTVNATAQPTLLPTATLPEPVTVIGDSQTLEGVSLKLEWVYLMDGQQAFGFSADGLAGGKTLGMPEMAFGRLVPIQYRGAGLALKDETQPVSGIYVVNQIVRDEATSGTADTHSEVSIAIPLLDANGQTLNTFRFVIKDELIHAGPFAGGNTYSTRANGLELNLDWIRLGYKDTQARLCFIPPDGEDWSLVAPALQLAADPNQLAAAASVTGTQTGSVLGPNGTRCQQVTFALGAKGAQAFYLTAGELATPGGKSLKGDWSFNWNQLPGQMQFPGIAALEPPSSPQVIGKDMTVTLERAYADIYRMVFVIFIQNPQDGFLVSSATLKDESGTELNTGLGINSAPDDPTRFTVELYPSNEFASGPFKGQLAVQIGKQFGSSSAQAQATFDLDLQVYPAVSFDPLQTVTVNAVEILLQRVKLTPSYTKAYLCFQKPTQADWAIGSMSTIKIGEDTGSLSSASLLFDAPAAGYMPVSPEPDWTPPVTSGRCVAAGFTVGHHNRPETLTLNIPELEQSMPESIPNDQLQAARQKLLAEGIDMDWVTSSGNGGGGGGPVINKKPQGMTDEQVLRLFYEEMGYYFPGPWTFTLELNP
jgi:hypothetical protein